MEIRAGDGIVGHSRPQLRRPSLVFWLIAAAVFGQAAIRLSLTPRDPSQGEGDYKHMKALVKALGSHLNI